LFTGLVQSIGQLQHLGPYQVKIICDSADNGGAAPSQNPILVGIELGDSIAVDGVCLTVEKILAKGFIASASPETLDKTTLGKVLDNGCVNLEPSLRVGSKIGGHFVTGHVDGIGQLDDAKRVANAWDISFCNVSPSVSRYIVNKGSIAVNGISLTVAECTSSGDWFSTAVIPVTYAETNLQHLRPGDWVNLEGDVLGKYVEKFSRQPSEKPLPVQTQTGDMSADFLAEHGYL